ncbi:Ribonuclease II/R [Forsythia ovata]|uniref:Ribonuclease II/R n=1 Tax=Forsythia ovata TaxID=205694 RepID=A0ABD1TMJ8_9LAMI
MVSDSAKETNCRVLHRLELKSSEELLENKSGKQMVQKGLLLEFKKDPERVLLAVAQKPDGKKNWMVDELLRRKHAKEAAEKEVKEFVKLLKSARKIPSHSKSAKSSWRTEEKIRHRIESLEAYAIDKHYISPLLQSSIANEVMLWSCGGETTKKGHPRNINRKNYKVVS